MNFFFWEVGLDHDPGYSIGCALDTIREEYRAAFESRWGFDREDPPDDTSLDDWIRLIHLRQAAVDLAEDAMSLVRPKGVSREHWTLPDVLEAEAERIRGDVDELVRSLTDKLESEEWESLSDLLKPHLPSDPRVQNSFFEAAFELEADEHFSTDPTYVAARLKKLLTYAVRHRGIGSSTYLRRVSECFVRGMKTEFAVMCRACLEAALEERIKPSDLLEGVRPEEIQSFSLEYVIQQCLSKGFLPPEAFDAAERLRKAGNRAVHGEPERIPREESLLDDLRVVLESLQSLPLQCERGD